MMTTYAQLCVLIAFIDQRNYFYIREEEYVNGAWGQEVWEEVELVRLYNVI